MIDIIASVGSAAIVLVVAWVAMYIREKVQIAIRKAKEND